MAKKEVQYFTESKKRKMYIEIKLNHILPKCTKMFGPNVGDFSTIRHYKMS